MHILLGLLVVALLCYVFYRTVLAPAAGPALAPSADSQRAFAFLSNGLIFFREHGGELKQLHSAYAQESSERRERSRERHSWKKGTSFNIAAGGGMRNFESVDKPLLATSAAFEAGGNLLYFLKDDAIGGLFRREAASGNEVRVLLKQNLHLEDLALSPDGEMVAASSQQSAGVANIAVLKNDGNNLREVTGGDTVDSAPAWIPGVPKRLLLPFRLLRAVFHYLNFFSMMYTRKPLTSASGPMVEADLKNILLQGRRIDAEKALRSARAVNGVPSLVPNSWELVSRTPNGDERVLATNVASYDISPDGTIVYSNGRGVFMLGKDGSSRLALQDGLIADVVAPAA